MALATAITMQDNDDLDAVADLFEVDDATLSDVECVFLATLAVLCRYAQVAQASTNTRDRLGERYGGHTAALVMQIANFAPHVVRELTATVANLTTTVLDSGIDDVALHQATELGPIH